MQIISLSQKGRFSFFSLEGWKNFRWGASHMQYAILDALGGAKMANQSAPGGGVKQHSGGVKQHSGGVKQHSGGVKQHSGGVKHFLRGLIKI